MSRDSDIDAQELILGMVMSERIRQDTKWGVQNHTDPIWHMVLSEEVGEVAQSILKAREENGSPLDIHDEIVQVAAVAIAWLESIWRNGPTPGRWEREDE